MQRNIYERVEVMFRLKDPALCAQIMNQVIAPYLADTEKTRILLPGGEYVRTRKAGRFAHSRNGFHFNAQEFLIEFSCGDQTFDSIPPLPAFLRTTDPATQPVD
jgi:polyphosphate kinase